MPGYISLNCSDDINECLNEDVCSYNGACVNDIGSYYCECNPGFTGRDCEITMNRYEVDILFLHFYHGGGRCADSSSTCSSGTGCCDDRHCISIECDYIFLYCERAMGAPVSYQRSEVKGYCPFNETQSYRTETKDHFLGQIYGVRNPIQLKRRSWVSIICLYNQVSILSFTTICLDIYVLTKEMFKNVPSY